MVTAPSVTLCASFLESDHVRHRDLEFRRLPRPPPPAHREEPGRECIEQRRLARSGAPTDQIVASLNGRVEGVGHGPDTVPVVTSSSRVSLRGSELSDRQVRCPAGCTVASRRPREPSGSRASRMGRSPRCRSQQARDVADGHLWLRSSTGAVPGLQTPEAFDEHCAAGVDHDPLTSGSWRYAAMGRRNGR